MIDPARINEMREATKRYGPANCWTGTTGTLAAMIHELLAERAELIDALNQCQREPARRSRVDLWEW